MKKVILAMFMFLVITSPILAAPTDAAVQVAHAKDADGKWVWNDLTESAITWGESAIPADQLPEPTDFDNNVTQDIIIPHKTGWWMFSFMLGGGTIPIETEEYAVRWGYQDVQVLYSNPAIVMIVKPGTPVHTN